jgi:hypothetical protein
MRIAALFGTVIGAAAVLLSAAPASAAWTKAETDRFVVYGEGPEARVRDYAVRLTLFDVVLRIMHGMPETPAQPSKLAVYLVRERADLRRVRPRIDSDVAGLYISAPQATFALALTGALGKDDTLFHEYAHHFMLANFPAAYPAWFVEGWAEYYMTAEVDDRRVRLGGYNEARAYWLFNARWLPMEDIISKAPWELPRDRHDVYYAQAWLLTHYMHSTPERADALNKASRAIAAGAEPVKAFQDATGLDMATLTRELRNYRRLNRLALNLKQDWKADVRVSRLPASADDLLLDRLRLATSNPAQPDAALLAEIRRKAAKYPGDPFAELTLAHAEFTWGDIAAGEAIVEQRLKAAPDDPEALYMSGLGQILAGYRNPAQRLDRFRAARANLAKAYQLARTDYRPIFAYASSRIVEPTFPTDNDLNVLMEARNLAPSLADASLLAGAALARRGRVEEARRVLAIVANNPHGGPAAAQARALMAGKSEQEAEAAAAAEPEEERPAAPEQPAAPLAGDQPARPQR